MTAFGSLIESIMVPSAALFPSFFLCSSYFPCPGCFGSEAINEFCSVHSLQQVYVDKFEQLDDSLMKSLQTVCDQWAPGIEIIAVRVTKPVIP